ncbi:EVE domain-containing protein [Patescibacteria group bacterium]|nr:EVE domain-containing protein [Patescibacteria group bacterium]
MKKYWLIKSEENCYSIDDLKKDGKTEWTGVRNYQARNFIRDLMQKGDGVLFYHSSSNPMGVVGVAKVGSKAYPDETALNPKDDHFDPKAKTNNVWVGVDIIFVKKLKNSVLLKDIKFRPELSDMVVAQQGSRLSIQPVSETHFKKVLELGGK